jgi:predicted nuclease with TOPRIM domain
MSSEQLQKRLDQLKGEYELGEARLRDLTQQEISLRETLLRISGAIQVLQELTGETQSAAGDETGQPPQS